MADQEYRIEHDTMGEVKVPAQALWRAQTQRAVENFPISGRGLEAQQIRALGLLKAACATVNKESGALDAAKADAIIAAAKEIADGKHDNEFPIDVFQTGSGTSSNMNTNEVIASIAKNNGVEVHPNDDVNMGQSSNDTFPTATHVAATEAAVNDLIPGLKVLQESLEKKADEWKDVVKSGRTHLMDAVPVTLGQEFSGYARQIELGIARVESSLPPWVSCRSAARPWAPASTPRPTSVPRSPKSSRSSPASTSSPRQATTSRLRPTATASSSSPAQCAR